MRDPKRVHEIMEEIKSLWLINPDMRFLQLVELIEMHFRRKGIDPFYVEDDELLNMITKTIMEKE